MKEIKSRSAVYLGLFVTTLSTLMYQLVLTRIFSVTMYYHFSFMAVSITMFGMTVGSILVYICKGWFPKEQALNRMGQSALIFALLIVATFFTHLAIPFVVKMALIPLWSVAINYFILSLPFVASGISVSIALTQFPEQIGRLYAFDLLGASLGCLLTVWGLNHMDAPTLVVVIALIASLAGIFYLKTDSSRAQRLSTITTNIFLGLLCLLCVASSLKGSPQLRLNWVKGIQESKPLYEKWNAFSRIAVWENDGYPDGWGISDRYQHNKPIKQRLLNIDSGASTSLTAFTGNTNELEFLKYDVTNAVHYLRQQAKVLVVGIGGGRDILSGLYFKQKEVWGVEINQAIFDTLLNQFGDYTHHLDRIPGVRLINDEARSFITRTDEKFDVIQVSLIDTWAASAAGAFVLTENSLYTIEAWTKMLKHLTSNGILTVSRWYSSERPWELYRLANLASATLRKVGIQDPRSHIIILVRPREGMGVATLMVSPTPFSRSDNKAAQNLSTQMNFIELLNSEKSSDLLLTKIVAGSDAQQIEEKVALDIGPPTDNNPFFFNMLRFKDIFNFQLMGRKAIDHNLLAVSVLAVLLATVVFLCLLAIGIPLSLAKGGVKIENSPYFVYFSAIGLGYMFIEISLIQKLNIFLGHPIYGMTVVLFSLLMATGIGSFFSQKLWEKRVVLLASLVVIFTMIGMSQDILIQSFEASSTPMRILVAAFLIFPIGAFMGLGFPIGMTWVSRNKSDLGPWLFGINGSMSIVGSVVAIWISLFFNIDLTFFSGIICYLIAGVTLAYYSRQTGKIIEASTKSTYLYQESQRIPS